MQQDKEKRMGTEPIGRLMISMAVPSIVAQIINILWTGSISGILRV